MGAKVTFDPVDRLARITIAPDANNEIHFDVKVDLYSDGKEDWRSTETLRRLLFPISAKGGDSLPGSKVLGSTFFINSDWKIELYPADHRFIVNGNFYSKDGSDPFVDPAGGYSIRVMQQVSSLVDSTVQQLADIEYAAFGGYISIDIVNGYSGTGKAPDGAHIGTLRAPSNNITDTLAISAERGIKKLKILSSMIGDDALSTTAVMNDFHIEGESSVNTQLEILGPAQCIGLTIRECDITGVLDGGTYLEKCRIGDLEYVNGEIEGCKLYGIITLDGNEECVINNCTIMDQDQVPIINMGGAGQDLVMPNYTGKIKVRNLTSSTEELSIGLNAGEIILEDTITAGNIIVSGIGILQDFTTGNAIVNKDGLLNKDLVTIAVWDAVLNGYLNNTAGKLLNDMNFLDTWIYVNTELAVNGTGTSEHPFNNFPDAVDFCESRGWKRLKLLADATIDRTLKNFVIEGIGGLPTIDFNGQNVDKSEFTKVKFTGQQVGSIISREVILLPGLTGVNGVYKECGIVGDIGLADGAKCSITASSSLNITDVAPQVIDLGEGFTNVTLNLRKYSGSVLLKNLDHSSKIFTGAFAGGYLELDATNTAGTFRVAGLPDSAITNNSSLELDMKSTIPCATTNADAVWNATEALTLLSDAAFLNSVEGGGWKYVGTQIIFYEDDNETEIARFDMKKADGNPAVATDSAVQRLRV